MLPPIVCVVGHSGSGKTSLLERLIAELAGRGLRVGAVKDTHHVVELDRPGKDSYRLVHAGAAGVVLATPRGLIVRLQRLDRARLEEAATPLAPYADLVLAESFRDSAAPKLVVYRAALGRPPLWPAPPVLAVVSDDPVPGWDGPTFHAVETAEICDFVLDRTGLLPPADPGKPSN